MRRKTLKNICVLTLLGAASTLAGLGVFMGAEMVMQKKDAAQDVLTEHVPSLYEEYEESEVSVMNRLEEPSLETEAIREVETVQKEVSHREETETYIKPVSSAHEDRWYYDQLNSEETAVFDTVYAHVLNRSKVIEFEQPIELELLEKIVYIMRWDFPEMYFLGSTFTYAKSDKGIVSYTPEYAIDQKTYDAMQKQVDEIVDGLLAQTADMSRYKKEVFFHDWLIENVSYQEKGENTANLYGTFVEGKAKCDGYSSAMMYLLRRGGVNAIQVIGKAESEGKVEGHAWNAVEMADGWYYLDVCWDDLDQTLSKDGIYGCYDYLNMTYTEMMSHRNVDETLQYLGEIPRDNLLEYNYYRRSSMYAADIKQAGEMLQKNVHEASRSGGGTFMIKCRNAEVYKNLKESYPEVIQEVINELGESAISCRFVGLDTRDTAIFFIAVEPEERSSGDSLSAE